MRWGGDMAPNMGNTINKIACATNRWKLNSATHIYSSRTPTGAIGQNIKKKVVNHNRKQPKQWKDP
ncbi:hypothetical protein E2C01_047842 [Portunus trituberculatus]|uniref:Uncharacterized protein n=1 Tax=Portunus trituberculatus TaxID=210409 RepID=A0A5B7G8J9_PORTR|nr:hypothetical protein [Portunus trituberculatus]